MTCKEAELVEGVGQDVKAFQNISVKSTPAHLLRSRMIGYDTASRRLEVVIVWQPLTQKPCKLCSWRNNMSPEFAQTASLLQFIIVVSGHFATMHLCLSWGPGWYPTSGRCRSDLHNHLVATYPENNELLCGHSQPRSLCVLQHSLNSTPWEYQSSRSQTYHQSYRVIPHHTWSFMNPTNPLCTCYDLNHAPCPLVMSRRRQVGGIPGTICLIPSFEARKCKGKQVGRVGLAWACPLNLLGVFSSALT